MKQLTCGIIFWIHISRFNPITFLCLSKAKIWISNVICSAFFFGVEVIYRFVDIGGIVDHHCLNFLFIIILYYAYF